MEFKGSYFQERIWYNDAFEREVLSDEGPTYYNIPLIFRIDGVLDVACIRKTLEALMEKHEVLRTYLLMRDEDLFQDIQDNFEPILDVIDWSGDKKTNEAAIAFLKEMNEKAFKGGIGAQLFKSIYLKLDDEISFFMLTIHHGICDDISKDILKKDIISFYQAIGNNGEVQYEEPPLQYVDFSEWQNELSDETIESQVMYWKRKLGNGVQQLALPNIREKVGTYIYESGEYSIPLSQGLQEKVNRLHLQYGFEKRDIFLAVFKILLMKYSGEKEICIGTSISSRINDELSDTIGPISNLAALNDELEEDSTFIEVINQVNETFKGAEEHSIIPFDRLVTDLNPKSRTGSTAFFDILFNYAQSKKEIITSKFEEVEVNLGWGKYDYNLLIKDNGPKTTLFLVYNAFYYNELMARQLVNSFMELAESLLELPHKAISDAEYISREEKDLLLNQWTRTNVDNITEETVHDIFSRNAREYPDRIAVLNGKDYITYRQLEESSNQYANWFGQHGVRKEDIVAIIMDRSIHTVELLFGILKAGACYLTIEPDAPVERMQYILGDSRPRFLIIEECYKGLGTGNQNIIILESLMNEKAGMDTGFTSTCSNENLAYVMYTSGTTGKPKGVMVEHRNLSRIIRHSQSLFNFTKDDVWSLFHSYSFDLSVWEIFGALLTGGKVAIVSRRVAKDITQFRRSLIDYGVTVLTQTPTAFNALVNEEMTHDEKRLKVRYIIFAGEALRVQNLIQWRDKYKETAFINMYGITETTIHVTFKKVSDEEIRENVDSIGVPLPNYQIYVLDKKQKIVPIGVKGEIYVGGSGVARGYFNKPELTAEKFIKNPFGEGILYRSGDLARWLPNGELEYLGRMDDQIKIRGFRIELGEIENAIKRQDGIQNAAVIAREKDGQNNICAYIVSDNKISMSTMRNLLEKNLPEYMIPAFMMQIERIPITGNGKLDKRALPDIEAKSEKEYVAPRNETEFAVIKVFEEILGMERIGIKDNFYELGGDSIKSIRVISKLRELNLELTVKDIMQMRVMENILTKVRKNADLIEYEQGEVVGEVPLTPIQHTFFKWNLSKPDHFNLSVMMKSNTGFDEDAIVEVLGALVTHHDILRATFKNGRQEIRGAGEKNLFAFEKYDFRDADGEMLEKLVDERSTEIQGSIDLYNGPLMKAALYHTRKYDHLMICIHHLVVDGVSLRILLEDISSGYAQYMSKKQIVLPQKTASYLEWARALEEYGRSEAIKSEISYWEKVSEEMKSGRIETDADGSKQGYDSIEISFSEDRTGQLLYEVGKAYNTEINDILLSALGIAVEWWKKQKKVAVHLEGHGREEINRPIDVNRTVGWFTSIYPVVIESSERIEDVIVKTKEMLRHIPNHGMGYGIIQRYEKCDIPEAGADICFNYLGQLDNEVKEDAEITVSELSGGRNSAIDNRLNNSISIDAGIMGGKLDITISFDKSRYSRESVGRLGGHYECALNKVIELCTSRKESVKTASDYHEDLTDDILKDILDKF